MYHRQQNKWYPKRCLLAHFEATLDFSRSSVANFLPHNNISQICYCGQNSLQSNAVNLSFLTIRYLFPQLFSKNVLLINIVYRLPSEHTNKIFGKNFLLSLEYEYFVLTI